jgi:hypothetical protein
MFLEEVIFLVAIKNQQIIAKISRGDQEAGYNVLKLFL